MTSTEPAGSDPAPRPKRRTFTSEYKLRIVADGAGDEPQWVEWRGGRAHQWGV